MRFSDIFGQESVCALLQRQIAEGRVPHAQLFCGPEGCGKLPAALAYATALLCRNRQGAEPCGHCNDCSMTRLYAHPDLHFVFPVVKRKSTDHPTADDFIDAWREQLADSVWFDRDDWNRRLGVENQQPIIYESQSDALVGKLSLVAQKAGGYKVVIVWHPEAMNQACANKMLKTLEEPVGQTAFILVSEKPEQLLPTILSRVQRTDFPALTAEAIEDVLRRRHGLTEADARSLSRSSQGNLIRALHQLRVDADAATRFDMFKLLMRRCYARDVHSLRNWSESISSWGRESQKQFLDYCQHLIRENFIYNFRQPALTYETEAEADFSQNFARFVNERNVIGMTRELEAAQRDIEGNVNPRMVFFDLALKLIVLIKQ